MGNWRTVHLIGTCDPAEVETIRTLLIPDGWYLNFGPLSITQGLCGLGDWPAETINSSGNLAERNYTPSDVAEHLRGLVTFAPSLQLIVHCGGDYESTRCIATLYVRDGQVIEGEPAVETLHGVSEATMTTRLLKQLVRPQWACVAGTSTPGSDRGDWPSRRKGIDNRGHEPVR